jgi:GAF domain-containing protein
MPYLTCSSCGSRTYVVSEGTCPSCGTALRRSSPAGPRSAADDQVHAKLAMAVRELRADTALLTEVREGHEHIRWQAGAGPYAGRSVPLPDTICERLLSGQIDHVVPDVAAEPALAGVQTGAVRAYIGVPFSTADARAYVLCCLAHEARPDLGEADVRFLQGLVESLRQALA